MDYHLNRHPERALTALFVKNVRKPGKYFDGHGLMLRVEKNGTRFWVQRITIRGKRCEIGLGPASLVSLADARDAALANRKLAHSGGDPLAGRRAAKAVMTFEEAARQVHALHLPTWRSKTHANQFINSLENNVFPRIGAVRVSEVTAADVLAVLTPIWTGKAVTARRVKQRIGLVMKWAVAQGWRQDNPAEAVTLALPKHDTRQEPRKALPYVEVGACIEAVRAANVAIATKLAFEFLVLTATRSGEVRKAVWSEINREARVWEIPASRMKANRPHRVPLSDRALEILHDADAIGDGSKIIFPGARRGVGMNSNTLAASVKIAGFEVDIHGFRTSFRTWVQEQTEAPREVAEAALAHVIGDSVEQAYARSDMLEKRRALMDAWAAYLAEPVGQAEP